MSIDSTRIEKVEVDIRFPAGGRAEVHVLREKDARDLMHALAGALGYTCTPKS